MSEATKERVLQELEQEAAGLRQAAKTVQSLTAAEGNWGPREILAHVVLWAIQAMEHFRLSLPPLDYGDRENWTPELVGTFNAAFEQLAGSTLSPGAAHQKGWRAVVRSVTLPLPVKDTPREHMRVDDAFNAAAVELVHDRPFNEVLRLTEETHHRFLSLLAQRSASDYADDSDLFQRVRLVITHHDEHRSELEALAAQAMASSLQRRSVG